MKFLTIEKSPQDAAKDAAVKVQKTESKISELQEKRASLIEKRRAEIEEREAVSATTKKALRDTEDALEEAGILLVSQREKLEAAWLGVRDELADKVFEPVPGLREQITAGGEKLRKMRIQLAEFEKRNHIEYNDLTDQVSKLIQKSEDMRSAPLPPLHELEALLSK